MIADKDVAAAAVLDVIRENAGEWLTDLRLFDVYQGKGIDLIEKASQLLDLAASIAHS